MKDIGRTADGNWLVEFSPEEYEVLVNLSSVVGLKGPPKLAGVFPDLRILLVEDHPGALAFVTFIMENRRLVKNLVTSINELDALLSPVPLTTTYGDGHL